MSLHPSYLPGQQLSRKYCIPLFQTKGSCALFFVFFFVQAFKHSRGWETSRGDRGSLYCMIVPNTKWLCLTLSHQERVRCQDNRDETSQASQASPPLKA